MEFGETTIGKTIKNKAAILAGISPTIRGEFGDYPNSARFLQTQGEFGDSPNLSLRSEILQTQFGDSPSSVRKFSKLSSEILQTQSGDSPNAGPFPPNSGALGDSPSSGPSLEKTGLSLEILQTRARFLQP